MKVSRAQAEENRERVINTASRLFRERGFDGIGVADLMKEAGLTPGGFYGQFESKEDLMGKAADRTLENSAKVWAKVAESSEEPLQAIAAHYLSARHRDRPGTGCLFAALGGDLARHGSALKRAVTVGVDPFIEMLTNLVPGRSKAARRKSALAAYASLIGGMVLARAVDDPTLSDEVLHAVAASLPGTKS